MLRIEVGDKHSVDENYDFYYFMSLVNHFFLILCCILIKNKEIKINRYKLWL